jgi:DNA polymerase V
MTLLTLFQIRDLVEQHGVIVKSSNYALYGDISRRVMAVVASEVAESEIYSIDEIFIDLAGMSFDPVAWARNLKSRILRETGIPVGIGISKTKTLAKIANKLAKKSGKANGVLVLDDQRWIDIALERTEVGDVWGVGRKYARKLSGMGIVTARHLRDMPDQVARKIMTVDGLKTVRELKGVICIDLDDSPAPRKTICVSRSFGTEITDREVLRDAVFSFVSRACSKLRRQDLVACGLELFILSNRFRTDQPQFSLGCEIDLTPATNDTRLIGAAISKKLDTLWRDGLSVKKAGILLLDLCPPADAPRDLFTASCLCENPLMEALDQLDKRFGKETVTVGRVAHADGLDWFTTSSTRSPCYTTRWSDLKSVR